MGIFSEENILVDNLGRVTWRPKFDAKTKCDVDVSSWPWDRHSCVVLLSPWSHKILNVFYEIKKYENSVSVHVKIKYINILNVAYCEYYYE